MSYSNTGSRKSLLIAAIAGALFSFAINHWVSGDPGQLQDAQSKEDTIKKLESSLAQKEAELNSIRLQALRNSSSTNTNTVNEICKQANGDQSNPGRAAQKITDNVFVLRKLGTASDNDRRSYSEKLIEFLSGAPSPDKAAIASKVIFELTNDRIGLPDYALQSIYNSQNDPDLRRVIAQVLSQRGNNALLESYIKDVQSRLRSETPRDRQDALVQLAKTRSANAADVVIPYLHDPDINVRLDALLALRDTGNQQQVGVAEALMSDPEPSVSSLAKDVASDLQNLSFNARTNLSRSDVEAALPPIP